MSRTEMLNRIDSLNREIAEVADQRAILFVTHPLSERHHRLLSKRAALVAELAKQNVIPFPSRGA